MTLELKHLAAYLPYGLKGRNNKFTYKLRDLSIEISDGFWEVDSEKLNFAAWGKHHQIKPILRPLSDLTNEIEHNGNKFIPIEYNAFKHSKNDIIEFQNKFMHYKAVKYGILERLLEWHFDVFGLIENGLAVDINTLEA